MATIVRSHTRRNRNRASSLKASEAADMKALKRLRANVRKNPSLAEEYGKMLRGEYPNWK